MKRLLALAAFLLASSTAQAQYQFEYGGRTIRIDPDRGTVSIPGVYDNTGKKAKRARGDQKGDPKGGDQEGSRSRPAPQDAKADPAPAPVPADTAAAPAAPPLAPPPAPPPPTAATAPDTSAHHHRQQCAGRYRRIAATPSSARTGTIAADPAGRAAACSGTVARAGRRGRTPTAAAPRFSVHAIPIRRSASG